MSVILPAVSISVSTRSNCDDLNQPRDPDVTGVAKRSWKWNGGMGEWKLGKRMSKQIFIFPRKSGRKKTGAEAIRTTAGRHVSRAVISFFMAGYTLPSFSSNLVQRAIFGREAWFTRRHKNAPRFHVDIRPPSPASKTSLSVYFVNLLRALSSLSWFADERKRV